jgi:hypothetical protein
VCWGRVVVLHFNKPHTFSPTHTQTNHQNNAPFPPAPKKHTQQVFVDGVYRPELSQLGNITGTEGWRAGSIHSFADDRALQEELLAEIAWAPEVGMRHTLAAGSLPFTSLNQVGGGVLVWVLIGRGIDGWGLS